MIDPTYLDADAAAVAATDPSSLTPGERLRCAHQERRDRAAVDDGSVSADPWDDARAGDMELLRRLHAERTAR